MASRCAYGSSADPPFPRTYDDCEGPHPITAWRARSAAGDPTPDDDPLIQQIRRGLTEFRGAYYQESGTLRDMIQNHLLQVMATIAMEPPAVFEPDAVRDERAKLLRSIRVFQPEEVAQMTVSLCLPAMSYVTGVNIPVDGGLLIQNT